MIPLRDNIPHQRLPLITVSLIIINIVLFIFEVMSGSKISYFIMKWGFIPKRVFMDVTLAEKILPVFSSMFLHAGVAHLIGNMLFMWIFADNVEDAMGHFNFLCFYIFCGLCAALTHFILYNRSSVPVLGASGAIAGVLGAYVRLFPSAKVLTLLPFLIYWEVVEVPAYIFLGVWFVYQFFLGLGSLGATGAGIAFWAHIGGFAAGFILVRKFINKKESLFNKLVS